MSHKKETLLLFLKILLEMHWWGCKEPIKKKKIWSACKATDKQIKLKLYSSSLEILQNDTGRITPSRIYTQCSLPSNI